MCIPARRIEGDGTKKGAMSGVFYVVFSDVRRWRWGKTEVDKAQNTNRAGQGEH